MNNTQEINLFSPEYNELFKSAYQYKKIGIVKAYLVDKKTSVETVIKHQDGTKIVETKNIALPGDYIVENPGGERYVISSDYFKRFYKEINSGQYQENKIVKAFQVDSEISFDTSWGKENLLAGGWIIDFQGIRYGVDREVFEKTYQKA